VHEERPVADLAHRDAVQSTEGSGDPLPVLLPRGVAGDVHNDVLVRRLDYVEW